jgi:hypothetical protein
MDDDGRWIRVTRRLRESMEREGRACTCGAPRAAALQAVELYDTARPEDWIGQLTEINRQLTEENTAMRMRLRTATTELHHESA